MYSTEKTRILFSTIIAIVIITGAVSGILAGIGLMGPTAENIQKATQYPTLYGDELLEEHWTMTCTLATAGIWLATAIVSTILQGKIVSLEIQEKHLKYTYEIAEIIKKEQKD